MVIHNQLKNIFFKITSYLKDIKNNLKKSDTRKIQSTLTNDSISSMDNDEEHVIHSKSDDNIEIMINDEQDEVVKQHFDSLKNRYQNNLDSIKNSRFVFDYLQLLYYEGPTINQNCRGLYIDSPHWIKNRKSTINPINKKDSKCFQYAVRVALNLKK